MPMTMTALVHCMTRETSWRGRATALVTILLVLFLFEDRVGMGGEIGLVGVGGCMYEHELVGFCLHSTRRVFGGRKK